MESQAIDDVFCTKSGRLSLSYLRHSVRESRLHVNFGDELDVLCVVEGSGLSFGK